MLQDTVFLEDGINFMMILIMHSNILLINLESIFMILELMEIIKVKYS